MLTHSDIQKIQSLANKPLLSQLPGRYVNTLSLRCIRRVLIHLRYAGKQ